MVYVVSILVVVPVSVGDDVIGVCVGVDVVGLYVFGEAVVGAVVG